MAKKNEVVKNTKTQKRTVTPGAKRVEESQKTPAPTSRKTAGAPKNTAPARPRTAASKKSLPANNNKYIVLGTVKYTDATPATGLTVIAYDKDESGTDMLGQPVVTTATGSFSIPYSEADFRKTKKEIGGADVIVCIDNDKQELLFTSKKKNNAPAKYEVNITVPAGQFVVRGNVTDSNHKLLAKMLVRAFDRDLRTEELLGNTLTDAKGGYVIHYTAEQFMRAEKHSADLRVRVLAAGGKTELAVSDTMFNAPADALIDLVVDAAALHTDSEWEHYLRDLSPLLENLQLHELTDKDLDFLTQETGIDAQHLRFVRLDATWREQQAKAKLPAAALYGLLRQGLPAEWTRLLSVEPSRWRQALIQAVASCQVPAALSQGVDAFVAQLTQLAINQSFVPPAADSQAPAPIGVLLAASTLSQNNQRLIAGLLLGHAAGDDPQQLLTTLTKAGVPTAALGPTRFAIEGYGLLNQHLPTLAALQSSLARSFSAGADLAQLNWAQWVQVAQTVATTGAKALPPGFVAAADYAEYLASRVERAFPTAVVAHRLLDDAEPIRRDVGLLLLQNPSLDLLTSPVESFLETAEFGNIKSDRAQLARQLGKEVRVARLSPAKNRAAHMHALLASDFDSAAKVVLAGRLEFKRRMQLTAGPASGPKVKTARAGRPEPVGVFRPVDLSPETTFANAESRVSESLAHGLRILDVINRHYPMLPAAEVAPGSRLATWADLFGGGNGCYCPPCESVHGPAAYLVDLFRFLQETKARTADPDDHPLLSVLFARRPDLQFLKLNCTNAETPLPYIDLVNELLEDLVAPALAADASSTPQTAQEPGDAKDVAARLRALPDENNTRAALYQPGGAMQAAQYPWSLPFDRRFLQTGIYFSLIGAVPADVLALTANPGDDLHRTRLGLSPALWARLQPSAAPVAVADVAAAWGLPSAGGLDPLVQIGGDQGLLARSGLPVDELVALIGSPLFAAWDLYIDRRPTAAADPCDIDDALLRQRIGTGAPNGSPSVSLGGVLTSDPVVVFRPDGGIDVFARGTDNALWHNAFNGTWSGWKRRGGVLRSGPAACVSAAGRLDVFARGTDDALWHLSFEGVWSDWRSLGGRVTADPAAVSRADGSIDVFVRGTDGALWRRAFTGVWSPWVSLGGKLNSDSAPAVCATSATQMDVFVRWTDDTLRQLSFNDDGWSAWALLNGGLTSGPSAVARSLGRIDVFVRGGDNALVRRRFDGVWAEPEVLGGTLNARPVACASAAGSLYIFERGEGDALWQWSVTRDLTAEVRDQVFDLMQRVLRLRQALTWPMATLQATLQALRAGDPGTAIDLVALSRMVWLAAQCGLPLASVATRLLALAQAAPGSTGAARALANWLDLLKVSAADHAHLVVLGLDDSLAPQEPAQRLERSIAALHTLALLRAANLDPAELRYLLRHEDLPPAAFEPLEDELKAQLDSVIMTILHAGTEPPALPPLAAGASDTGRVRWLAEEAQRLAALGLLARLRLEAAAARLAEISGFNPIDPVITDAPGAPPQAALLTSSGVGVSGGVVQDFIALALADTTGSDYESLRTAAAASLLRVRKTARLLVVLKLTAPDALALTRLNRDNGLWLDFNTLPVVTPATGASGLMLSSVMGLVQSSVVQGAMPQADRRLLQLIADITDAADATAEDAALALESVTGWGSSFSATTGGSSASAAQRLFELAKALMGEDTGADSATWKRPDTYARLQSASLWLQQIGLPATALADLRAASLPGSTGDGLKSLARSQFGTDADWYKALTPAMDRLRAQQRDALLAHILHTNTHAPRWKTADDVYAHLLIDVQMGPCQLSSRIVQAHSAVQLFVQRCLMNLERPEEVALGEVSDNLHWRQWDWMKNYRVWEAGRKVFLHPENWIEADLRDVKSPFFEDLENELLQDEITPETAERAVRAYLGKLHEVARLDVRAMYEEVIPREGGPDSRKFIHMVGRTRAVPHVHYYRKRDPDLSWTPWEKIELSIDAEHLVLAVVNRRPMLFWPQWQQVQDLAWRMTINQSVLEFGRWSAPSSSRVAMQLPINSQAKITFRPRESKGRLDLIAYLYEPVSVGGSAFTQELAIAAFVVDQCSGQLSVSKLPNLLLRYVPLAVKPVGQGLEDSVEGASPAYLRRGARDEAEQVVPAEVESLIELLTDAGFGGVLLTSIVLLNDELRTKFEEELRDTAGRLELFNGAIEGFRLVPCQQFAQLNSSQPYVFQHGGRQLFAIRKTPDVQERAKSLSRSKYVLESGDHPLTCDLLESVRAEGLTGLYRPNNTMPPARGRYPRQLTPGVDDWVADLSPNSLNVFRNEPGPPYPLDGFDFDVTGAYSLYNWEVFFHIPLLLADRLSKNGRFKEARQWFHTVFDPTDVSRHASPQKFWQIKPLFNHSQGWSAAGANETLEDLMARLSVGDEEVKAQVAAWRNEPFNPHLIARMRLVAYMKTVVQKYIENLTAWADSLFRRDTMESVNEATQLYVLGNDILGAAPVVLPPLRREARSYAELTSASAVDDFANKLVGIETGLPLSAATAGPAGRAAPGVSMLYFCIPNNPRLQELRATLNDRLFKIRHCMNIDGRTRQLALFAPPIDPALLVRARAAGLDIGAVLNMALGQRMVHYRFQPLLQKAFEFCSEVRGFGNALLSALEKRDGEQLAQLRARHEVGMLKLTSLVKTQQVEEAVASLDATRMSRGSAEIRLDHYLSRGFMNSREQNQINNMTVAHVFESYGQELNLAASIASLFPDVTVGFPCNGTTTGGSNIGDSYRAVGSAFGFVASQFSFQANLSAIMAGHERRRDDWELQAELARKELVQIDQQIIAAEIRVAIAERDLSNHEQQIAQSEEAQSALRDKFTNAQLYSWMSAQLSALHYQSYQMAVELARQAQAAAESELDIEPSIIQLDNWDGGRKGLLAGDRLAQDLRRLEIAYMQSNTRQLEITSNVSLRRLNPIALWALRSSVGSCSFFLPTWLFDMDFPGHQRRRIKSVSISVPGVVGPYGGVNGILTCTQGSDVRRIATSSGQNDAGVFQIDFRDERYLPFEGVSLEEPTEWTFSLPAVFRPFDYETISDVVLHIQYTARFGDEESLSPPPPLPTSALKLLVSVRHDFPVESRQLRESLDPAPSILLEDRLFPYFARNRIGTMNVFKLDGKANSVRREISIKKRLQLEAGEADAYFVVEYAIA